MLEILKNKKLYYDHLIRLNNDDRILRFAGYISDESIERYVNGIKENDIILAYIPDNIVRGAIHISFNDNIAEVGLSVESTFRSKGIGTNMFYQTINICKDNNIDKLFTMCLSHNSWMIKKAREFGMTMKSSFGETTAIVNVKNFIFNSNWIQQ